MIRAAFVLELRNLLRSPLRLVVLALVLGVGAFVIVQGQADVTRWQATIDKGHASQEESLAEARGYFSAGKEGPEDRAWVKLSQARWQDYYAATRVARKPAPLAGIAFASPESAAVTMRLGRRADPLLATGDTIENPALAASGGGLDLVSVLALLLPLLVLALGLEVGGYERSAGLLPLVRVQSGRDRSWLWARSFAVASIAAGAGLALTIFAAFYAAAPVAEAMPLAVLVLAYVATWTMLLGLVAQFARHPSQGAVALGSAWIVFCVLLPSIAVERAAALAADDFAVELTVEARDCANAHRQLNDEQLYKKLFARFPDLEKQAPVYRPMGRSAAREGMRIVDLEQRLAEREKRAQEHAQLLDYAGMASPSVAFTNALERLAGRGPAAAHAFRRTVAGAAAKRMQLYVEASWSGEKLDAEDFEALVAATPPAVEPPSASWWRELLILCAWCVAFLALARVFSRRGRVAAIA